MKKVLALTCTLLVALTAGCAAPMSKECIQVKPSLEHCVVHDEIKTKEGNTRTDGYAIMKLPNGQEKIAHVGVTSGEAMGKTALKTVVPTILTTGGSMWSANTAANATIEYGKQIASKGGTGTIVYTQVGVDMNVETCALGSCQ